MRTQHSDLFCHRQLGLEAMEARVQALGEYLAVYRASYAAVPTRQYRLRIRELRRDIWRLRGWAWYLAALEQRPLWLRLLEMVTVLFASLLPGRTVTASRRRSRGQDDVAHLPSISLLERAYAALEDDLQGRMLTLQLAQRQRPSNRREQSLERLAEKLLKLQHARQQLWQESGRVPLICAVLGSVLRMAGWIGLVLPQTDMADR